MMTLNAREITELESINMDKRANDKSLEVSLNYHTNRMIELERASNDWWDKIGERFGIDPKSGYKVSSRDNMVVIIPSLEEDKK